jgi:hypothetical protein
MSPRAELQYDHDVLRAKLAILEDYLPQLEERQGSTLRLADSIACCLRAHSEREEAFLDRPSGPPPSSAQQLHDEHLNHRMRLAVFHALLAERMPQAKEQVVEQARHLITDLQDHFAKEEALYATRSQHGRDGGGAGMEPVEAPEYVMGLA